jgi:hypothetical protein
MPIAKQKIYNVKYAVAAAFAATLLSGPAIAANGFSPTGISDDGISLAFVDSSDLQVAPTGAAANADETLLAVGSGRILADESGSRILILGQTIGIALETSFPRGVPSNDDYVAVAGVHTDEGNAIATRIVRLGGNYVRGGSPVYLRGRLSNIGSNGRGSIGLTDIDLNQAYYNVSLFDLRKDAELAVFGYEVADTAVTTIVIVTTASSIGGINGSGARGINGSGAKGISGSGARGINGSGARGINGSGARGINGSGARGINGSGAKGINGSGAKGINGSGARAINGSGGQR